MRKTTYICQSKIIIPGNIIPSFRFPASLRLASANQAFLVKSVCHTTKLFDVVFDLFLFFAFNIYWAPLHTCIPYLSLDRLIVYLDTTCCELNTNSTFGFEIEFITSETSQKVGFANAGITNQNN